MEPCSLDAIQLFRSLEKSLSGSTNSLPVRSYEHVLHYRQDILRRNTYSEKELLFLLDDVFLSRCGDLSYDMQKARFLCSDVLCKERKNRDTNVKMLYLFLLISDCCRKSHHHSMLFYSSNEDTDSWFSGRTMENAKNYNRHFNVSVAILFHIGNG